MDPRHQQQVASTAALLEQFARAAGVRVDLAALEHALANLSPEELAHAPESYRRSLEEAAAIGLDLSDPALDSLMMVGSADEVDSFISRVDGCVPST